MEYEHYVELLMRAVTGYLYLDQDHSARTFDETTFREIDRAVAPKDQLQRLRQRGLDWPGVGYSMCGFDRLRNIEHCLRVALQDGVEGDFVETGVWRGGACIFAAGVLRALGQGQRKVWVADSFKGLPPPDVENYPKDRGMTLHEEAYLSVSRAEVERAFDLFGLMGSNVRFIEGFFEQSLQSAPVEKLCVARLDGDMYSSTISALNALYPKISPGGFVIIDDYAISQCREAVQDFHAAHQISVPIENCDWTGVYWRVPIVGS